MKKNSLLPYGQMTRINLLPWREERRGRQQRRFMSMLAFFIILAGLGVLGAHMYVVKLIDNQETRNQFLSSEIERLKAVEKEIKEMEESEARLLARFESIKQLQAKRPDMVKALDNFVRILPGDVYLKSLNSVGNRFTIAGNARVNKVVSDFMREIEKSPVFAEPGLKVVNNIKTEEDIAVSAFELNVNRLATKTGQTEESTQ